MNIQEEKTAIENLVAEFALMLNTAKAEAIPAFFSQDAIFMPEGHKSIAPNKLSRRSGFLARVKFKIIFKAEDIVIDSGYGFARFTALTDMQNPETGALTQKRSRDFFVFRKEQAQWKIFRYMFNDVKEV